MKLSGFRILISLKIAYLLIFRIQDPESSGSEDPDGKSHEGPLAILKLLGLVNPDLVFFTSHLFLVNGHGFFSGGKIAMGAIQLQNISFHNMIPFPRSNK